MKKIIILLVVLIFIAGGAGFYCGYQKGAEQYDVGFQTGHNDGYNNGLAVGYQEGKEKGYVEGYRACQAGEELEVKPYQLDVSQTLDTSNFIQSGLIWMWTIRFENLIITDISDYTLTLAPSNFADFPLYEWKIGDEELKVIVGPLTKITMAVTIPVPGEDGRVTTEDREIKFADLQVGNVVEVYARWQEIDNMEPYATIRVITDWGKLKVEELEKSKKVELSISWAAGITAEVEKINGRILSLQRESEKSDVFIREDTVVSLLVRSSGSRTEVSFADLQVGDSVSVTANFTEDKRLEGVEITIFPRD